MQEPFTIYLRAKEPELLLSNRYKEEADKRIEIIPEKSSAFDFISIIDFINAVHFDFYAIPMIRKRDKSSYIEIYRNEIKSPIRLPILYSFIVEFGKDFSYIKVFIKNYMHDFEYINKNETLCIRLTNKIQLNQFSYQVFQSFIRPNTIIYEIAKYFTDKYHNCPDCVKYYFAQMINRTIKQENPRKIKVTIEDLLNFCPGHIRIQYLDKEKEKFSQISIVFPWIFDLIKKFQYFELDGSFRAMKPYSFCIAQGIIFNESFPFAISIAQTESTDLYANIFNHLNSITKTPLQIIGKTVLSDMGSSIISICNTFKFIQYFCHRHLIEHFGAHCVLGLLCRKILKTYSAEEYGQKCIEIKEILNNYKEERKKLNTFTLDLQNKIRDLETMISGDAGDINSNYFYIRWALWIRRDQHVGSCSNHNESLHAFINQNLSKCLTLEEKLSNLIKKTLKHCSNIQTRKGSSIRRKLKNIINLILQKTNNPTFDIFFFCDDKCKCGELLYNKQIYGVEIPCLNQILLPAKDIILDIIQILKNNKKEITINKLIYQILLYKHIFQTFQEKNRLKLVEQIFQIFPGIPVPTDKITTLVFKLHSCFHFTPPEIPEIKNMWDIHHVEPTFASSSSNQNNNNNNNNNNNTDSNWIFGEMEEEEIFFSRYQIEDKYFRKKIIMETVKEILKVYPMIGKNIHDAYEICLDNFENCFSSSKLDIAKLIAKYKITCWRCADQLAESDSFFCKENNNNIK